MRTLASFAVLMLVAACQTAPPEMTEAEIAQLEAEVLEWADAWMAAGEIPTPEDRCGAWRNLAHPDQVVRLRGGEPQGRAAWFDYCMGIQVNWQTFTGEWTETDVRVLSPDAVVFIGRSSGTWVHADGRVIRYPAGVQRLLLERAADGWGFTMHDNSNGPSEVVEGG
jgi:hypothetical protein